MYCRKCGKWIDYDAEICAECQQNEELFKVEGSEQPNAQNAEYQYFFNNSAQQPNQQQAWQQQAWQQQAWQQPINPNAQRGSRMEGFGLALAGTIVSFFAFIFSCVFMALAGTGLSSAMVMFFFATGLTIFTLISGIKSLNRSKACTRAGKVKPIPAFVMGIINVVMAGLSFLYIFLGFVALVALL